MVDKKTKVIPFMEDKTVKNVLADKEILIDFLQAEFDELNFGIKIHTLVFYNKELVGEHKKNKSINLDLLCIINGCIIVTWRLIQVLKKNKEISRYHMLQDFMVIN